jgi:hypothetical protein
MVKKKNAPQQAKHSTIDLFKRVMRIADIAANKLMDKISEKIK